MIHDEQQVASIEIQRVVFHISRERVNTLITERVHNKKCLIFRARTMVK